MAELAQAYIHLRPYSATDKKLRALGDYAQRIAVEAATEIYGGGVVIEVELEEGSLRGRITVVGSVGAVLLGLYGTVANYKGFKESLVEMCDDAREFAVDVCEPFAKKAGVPKDEIYRFERRLKTPGKLYRISKRLEKLESSVGNLSPRDVQKELSRLRAELDVATSDLSEEERKLIEANLKSDKLPPPKQWPVHQPVAARKEDEPNQIVLFDGASIEEEATPKNRLFFRSRTPVPLRPKRRQARLKNAGTGELLPPTPKS